MKNLILIIVALIFSQANAGEIYVNSNGELLLNGDKNWTFKEFENLGYKVGIDYRVYVSEGVLSDSKSDYDVDISKNNKLVAYFEIRDNEIWRGNLVASEIPIHTLKAGKIFKIGMSLSDAIRVFGDFEDLGSGHDVGSYLSFNDLKESSLHTKCSFFHLEQTEKERKMPKAQLYEYCKIDSMLFYGYKRLISKNEF